MKITNDIGSNNEDKGKEVKYKARGSPKRSIKTIKDITSLKKLNTELKILPILCPNPFAISPPIYYATLLYLKVLMATMADEYHLYFSGKPSSKARFFHNIWPVKEVVEKYPFDYTFTLTNGDKQFPGGNIEIAAIEYRGGFGATGQSVNKIISMDPLQPSEPFRHTIRGFVAQSAGLAKVLLKVVSNDKKPVKIHQPLGGISEEDPQLVGYFFVEDEGKIKNEIYVLIVLVVSLLTLVVGIVQLLKTR
jgi:hypothetical protein